MTTVQRVLNHLPGHRKAGSGWSAKCPAHEDKSASLSVGIGKEGRALVHCHAGCELVDVLEAMGLTPDDLFPPKPAKATGRWEDRIAATYDYTDEQGRLLYQVVRLEPKDFRQRRPEGNTWNWSIKGVRRVVYRLPAVLEAIRTGKRVYMVEGEKDADNLAALGLCSTTNSGGADKWGRRRWGCALPPIQAAPISGAVTSPSRCVTPSWCWCPTTTSPDASMRSG